MKYSLYPSKEMTAKAFERKDKEFTSRAEDLKRAHYYIISESGVKFSYGNLIFYSTL